MDVQLQIFGFDIMKDFSVKGSNLGATAMGTVLKSDDGQNSKYLKVWLRPWMVFNKNMLYRDWQKTGGCSELTTHPGVSKAASGW